MKTIDKFKNIDFFKVLVPILQSYISQQKSNRIVTNTTKFEDYNIKVLLSASNITECIDQLNYSIEMLSGYRKRKNSTMNRYDYIVFFLENFYLRITSIFDRVLRLTNLVFEIGLPERECKKSTIIENEKIKETKLASSMKEIDKFIEKYRYLRNKIAHSESYSEKRLLEIQLFYIALDSNDKDSERYKTLYKYITDKFVEEKKNELRKIVNELEKLLQDFFIEISPYVKIIGEKYKKTNYNIVHKQQQAK